MSYVTHSARTYQGRAVEQVALGPGHVLTSALGSSTFHKQTTPARPLGRPLHQPKNFLLFIDCNSNPCKKSRTFESRT
jgi:hypothetical protein